MDIRIRSKLKDIGLLANPFHLYGWLDDNRELCQRHSAPNKMKMDGRNDESTLLEDSRGIVLPKNHIMSAKHEIQDFLNDDLDPTISENTSQFEIQSSPTHASNIETSRAASRSDIDDLLDQVSQLQSLLAMKEAKNKQMTDEKRILVLKCKKIQREKEMVESHTARTLARKENLHQLELKEYKTQVNEQQEKINAALTANDELMNLLAQQQAENERIASENAKLESRIAQFRREMEALQANNQRDLPKNRENHLGVLQECNVQVRQKQDKLYASDRHNRREPSTNYVKYLNLSTKTGY